MQHDPSPIHHMVDASAASVRERLQEPVRNAVGLAWRIALYFSILIGAFRLLGMVNKALMRGLGLHFASTPGQLPAEAVLSSQLRLLLAAVLALAITNWVGRDRLGSIVRFRRTAIRDLLRGLLLGLLAIAATLGAIACFGGYTISGPAMAGGKLAYFVPLWLGIGVINGFAENLAVLGYPLFRMARTIGWLPAMILACLLFAAWHMGNPGENMLGIMSLVLITASLAVAIWLTGDMWLSAGLHAGMVISEDLLFSVPDSGQVYTGHLVTSALVGPAWLSGGDAGPEGSILAFPIFAVFIALLWFGYRHRRDPSRRLQERPSESIVRKRMRP